MTKLITTIARQQAGKPVELYVLHNDVFVTDDVMHVIDNYKKHFKGQEIICGEPVNVDDCIVLAISIHDPITIN